MLWQINISIWKKIGLGILFSGGLLIVLFASLRSVYLTTVCREPLFSALYHVTDPQQDHRSDEAASGTWSVRETFVAVMVTNFPMIFHLARSLALPALSSLRSRSGGGGDGGGGSNKSETEPELETIGGSVSKRRSQVRNSVRIRTGWPFPGADGPVGIPEERTPRMERGDAFTPSPLLTPDLMEIDLMTPEQARISGATLGSDPDEDTGIVGREEPRPIGSMSSRGANPYYNHYYGPGRAF